MTWEERKEDRWGETWQEDGDWGEGDDRAEISENKENSKESTGRREKVWKERKRRLRERTAGWRKR